MHEIAQHAQTAAVSMVQQSPGMDFRTMGLPVNFDGRRPPLTRRALAVGEDTAEIVGAARD